MQNTPLYHTGGGTLPTSSPPGTVPNFVFLSKDIEDCTTHFTKIKPGITSEMASLVWKRSKKILCHSKGRRLNGGFLLPPPLKEHTDLPSLASFFERPFQPLYSFHASQQQSNSVIRLPEQKLESWFTPCQSRSVLMNEVIRGSSLSEPLWSLGERPDKTCRASSFAELILP